VCVCVCVLPQIAMCEEATRGVDASSGSGTLGLGSGPILIDLSFEHMIALARLPDSVCSVLRGYCLPPLAPVYECVCVVSATCSK
jgi:hypothetical protein